MINRTEQKYHPFKTEMSKISDSTRYWISKSDVDFIQERSFKERIALVELSYDEMIEATQMIYKSIASEIISKINSQSLFQLIDQETDTNLDIITIFELRTNAVMLTKKQVISRLKQGKYEFKLLLEILEEIDKATGEYY